MSAVRALVEELLSDLLESHFEQVPVIPFPAMVNLQPVMVTAVLERTAVAQVGRVEDKVVVRHDRVLVDPASVRWVAGAYFGYSGSLVNLHASRRGRVNAMRTRHGEKAAERMEQQQKLRVEGKARCSRCGFVGSRSDFNANRYCKPCANVVNKANKEKKLSAST